MKKKKHIVEGLVELFKEHLAEVEMLDDIWLTVNVNNVKMNDNSGIKSFAYGALKAYLSPINGSIWKVND